MARNAVARHRLSSTAKTTGPFADAPTTFNPEGLNTEYVLRCVETPDGGTVWSYFIVSRSSVCLCSSRCDKKNLLHRRHTLVQAMIRWQPKTAYIYE
jgi:hypothetical protein